MTRLQLETLRDLHEKGRTWVNEEKEALLAAAERALELAPFIDAAMEHEGECDRWKEVRTALDAAIDRAEVKP